MAKSVNLVFGRELVADRAAANAVGVAVFVMLTALGAYVRIPLGFTPVPITLQTFFVFLSGAILGKRLGTLSQAGYVLLGILGLPIFSGTGCGLAYLAGPTGGYLIGFLVSAFVIGRLIDLKQTLPWKVASFIIGLLSLYICGVLWLSCILDIHLYRAILLGVVPFIPGAVIKLTAATFIYYKFGPRIKKIFII